jgi:RNA polymerase sigma factor (sigma-70 family)
MEPSDEALVRRCRRGDEAAWEALVNRYRRLVYTVPLRAGLDEEGAADVFQRVFAALVEQLDHIAQPERLSAWLVTTARRETWRMVRRRTPVLPTGSLDAAPGEAEELPDAAVLPDEELVRLEDQHAVRTAVASLDPRCRDLVTLLFFRADPPPYVEIAATLGIAVGSIGPIRARCLERVRRQLAEAGF